MAQAELFAPAAPASPRLAAWAPRQWAAAPDWQPLLAEFFGSETGLALGRHVAQRLAAGVAVYPPQPLRALELTPLAQVKVLILGQDPYHGPGQAEGLAFSVAPGVRLPPSLRNIYKELAREPDLTPAPPPADGSLVRWARQGVLLLNTSLTVEDGQPASHAHLGWEVLTDALIRAVLGRPQPVAFMLWGGHAQLAAAAAGLGAGAVDRLVLRANHPSPLSASRGPEPFLGCGHFSAANAFLRARGLSAIAW